MNQSILELSERGQLTIPKKIRDQVDFKRFICHTEDGKIILEPLQTREDFLSEMDSIEKDYKKNGGIGLKDIKKKYDL